MQVVFKKAGFTVFEGDDYFEEVEITVTALYSELQVACHYNSAVKITWINRNSQ